MDTIGFCATVAIDPALFARYLVRPGELAAELGLNEGRLLTLRGGDRDQIGRMYFCEACLEQIELGRGRLVNFRSHTNSVVVRPVRRMSKPKL